ncbi:MAG: hypothetical protein PWP51_3014 [Clostridiales bacterium]|nr:hypothetical protein [Clostridiales bacterium]
MSEKQMQSNSASEKPKKGGRGKKVIGVLLLIVIAAAGYGLYYFNQHSNYFTTENAKVTAKMYYVTPLSNGELIEWSVNAGEKVQKNQVLGRQATLPYITSPIDGTVVVNSGIAGQMVSPATQLAVVADTDHLYIGVNVEETDITKVKVGQTVDVTLDAYPGTTFKGVVSDIDLITQTYFSGATSFSTSGTFTKVTQLIPVKVFIENPEQLPMTFGMNATVKIHIGESVSEETATAAAALAAVETTPRIYTATLEASDSIDVIPNVAGKVENIYKSVGDSVKAGDLLFELSKTDRELVANQAAASYKIAETTYQSSLTSYNSKSSVTPARIAYQNAADNYDRIKALYDSGSASKTSLDSAKAQMDSAKAQLDTASQGIVTSLETTKAQVDAAKASWDIALKNLEDCTVKAPMDGEIAMDSIDIGDMVSSQTKAMSIIDAKEVKLTIEVTESQIGGVTAGEDVTVTVPALGIVKTGKIITVAPASDAATGTFPVDITVSNDDSALKPGMVVQVTLAN